MAAVYGAAAGWRRRWYARDPARRRWLSQPVVSIGNLRAGGSGKTPAVEAIARLLTASGERPAILTRGYARATAADGVTVVSDESTVCVDVDRAGDEALMMARHLAGVPVLVGADRYLSGLLAERRFGATVHLLDDGFQHLALGRDVDLLVTDAQDLHDRVIPAGPLRERAEASVHADAALVAADATAEAERVGRALGIRTAFLVARAIGAPRLLHPASGIDIEARERVVAVAGIGRPSRFFGDLAAQGWQVASTLTFSDHHRFTQKDVDSIEATARSAGAAAVLTTEKDAVKLERCRLDGLVVAAIPLTVTIEPVDAFARWLADHLDRARAIRHLAPALRTSHPAPHSAPRTPHSAPDQ